MSDRRLTLVEGQPWPERVLRVSGFDRALNAMDAQVRERFGIGLIRWTPSGQRTVGQGLAGVIQIGPYELRILPKTFAGIDATGAWSASLPIFLRIARELSFDDVYITGRGAFAPSNALLPWLADYYALVLWKALHTSPYLRYEPFAGSLPYVRGRVAWDKSALGLAVGEPRVVCGFSRYQSQNTLNQLLKWAAVQLMRLPGKARIKLAASVDALAGASEAAPERHAVERIRIPSSLRVYDQPFKVARAVYLSAYPSLGPGGVPAAAFLVNMPAAFERFVDGLVYVTVSLARKDGQKWYAAYQRQHQLAEPVPPEIKSYYTRPDNSVWKDHPDYTVAGGGVVVDAKYKGSVLREGSYRRPVNADFYQLVASCLALGWRAGVIVAPAIEPWQSDALRTWTVQVRQDPLERIRLGILKLDLGALRSAKEVRAAALALQGAIQLSLTS